MSVATKNIVFDWNCTLLDDVDALHAATNRLMETEGHQPLSVDDFRTHYAIPLEQMYRNLGFSETQIDKLMQAENSSFHDHYEPMAEQSGLRTGAIEILEHAHNHGVQSLILSNHLVEPIRTQLRRLEIEDFFAAVLAYADRATQFRDMTKGERLQRFMSARGMTPTRTLIIGDSVEEIHIGREQGLISVALTGGCASEARLRSENPDYLIHSLHELKPIMQERGFVS